MQEFLNFKFVVCDLTIHYINQKNLKEMENAYGALPQSLLCNLQKLEQPQPYSLAQVSYIRDALQS